MLIKLTCDGSCPFVAAAGLERLRVMWSVESDLPIDHPTQIRSLIAAIKEKDKKKQVKVTESGLNLLRFRLLLDTSATASKTGSFASTISRDDGAPTTTTPQAVTIDVTRTPAELSLTGGAVVVMCINPDGDDAAAAAESQTVKSKASGRHGGIPLPADTRSNATHRSRHSEGRGTSSKKSLKSSVAKKSDADGSETESHAEAEAEADGEAAKEEGGAGDETGSRRSWFGRKSRTKSAAEGSVAGGDKENGQTAATSRRGSTFAADVPTDDEVTSDYDEVDMDEHYISHEIGWFPFMLRPSEGEPMVAFNDPFIVVKEEDAAPVTQTLCETCSSLVTHGDALRVGVDQHYKPMLMHQDFMEVCLEKLGGGQLKRWQTRYVHFSEKAIDWFADRPKPGIKSRIHGHRYLVRDGECQVTEIIKDPSPDVYPKCKDENFFYFGVSFANPSKTYLFRVTNNQQKSIILTFLRQVVQRAKTRRATRNPVVWKKWADMLLVNAANVGELHGENADQIEQMQLDIAEQQERLGQLMAERPQLTAALHARTSHVQALRNELASHEHKIDAAERLIEAAEGKVDEERGLLREKELEMGDEVRKATMLEQHTLQQRKDAEERISDLERRIAELRKKENDIFKRWRLFEEQHLVKKANLTEESHTGLFSFSETGVGVHSPPQRLSLERATIAAHSSLARIDNMLGEETLALLASSNSNGATPLKLTYSGSPTASAKRFTLSPSPLANRHNMSL